MHARNAFLVVVAAGALFLGACGDDEEAGDSSAPAAAEQTTDGGDDGGEVASGDLTLNIADFSFVEEDVTVKAGTTVTWENADDAVHTATADDDSFDTGNIAGGDSGEVTLEEPGTYSYFCEPHPFMKASITVE